MEQVKLLQKQDLIRKKIINIFLIIFLFSAFIGDVLTTYICINIGMKELNIVANFLITCNLFVLVKIVLLILLICLLYRSLSKSNDYRNVIVASSVIFIVVNFIATINNFIGLLIIRKQLRRNSPTLKTKLQKSVIQHLLD